MKKMISFREYVLLCEQEITDRDLNKLESYLDRLWGALDVDIEITGRHFRERINDMRNNPSITLNELVNLFREAYKKYGVPISRMSHRAEGLLMDIIGDVNVPFLIKHNHRTGELELTAKTIMRKRNFRPNSSRDRIYRIK